MVTQTVDRGAVMAIAGVPLVVEKCCRCDCVFAMPKNLYNRARNDSREGFYCPNGHRQYYTETLRERVAEMAKDANRTELHRIHLQEQHDASQRSLAATRGHLTRVRRRVGKGVCPCCNRTFKDLARHMHSKHPRYGSKKGD